MGTASKKGSATTKARSSDKTQWRIEEIFDDVSIGLILLNHRKKAVLFANQYFQSFEEKVRETVLADIYEHMDKSADDPLKLCINSKIRIEHNHHEYIFGFTTYPIGNELAAVLFLDITSKCIYLENKQKNQFFDDLSELVAEIAHEVGNPLAGINLSLQVLQSNLSTWPAEKIEKYVSRTVHEIERLTEFLETIKEISTRDEIEKTPVNLKGIINKVLFQNEHRLKQKQIVYHNMVDGNITVLINEGAFHQVILNLLNNSLQVLAPNEEIFIYVEGISDYIKLVFRNNGEPIPDDLMGKIFSPFFSTREDGEGLGLAISLKLMTRMGGTMKAVPLENGMGAKFLLHIPYEKKNG
jgi:signal transduction histidine kinase